jgi:hypothetical protein
MLINEVTSLSVDNSSKSGIQCKQTLIFFLIFEGKVVLLVDFVIASDSLLKAGPINVILVSFRGKVS